MKIDSRCVFVVTAGVTLLHSSTAVYVYVHACVCVSRNRVQEDVTQCEILSDQIDLRPFSAGASISLPMRRQRVFLYLSLSVSISLSLAPSRLAEYFCINHHDTGKATQFSAPVGKVHGVLKRWHKA